MDTPKKKIQHSFQSKDKKNRLKNIYAICNTFSVSLLENFNAIFQLKIKNY